MEKVKFREPSLGRLFFLSKDLKDYSLMRALQYEFLRNLTLKGKVLDYGGGENSGYRNIIKCENYESVNIDSSINPTWKINVGDSIPCEDGSFDTVVSMNTLEHIYDARSVVDEMYRTLKPGGELILFVPFLFPIHGHPDDYFRPTPSWFNQSFLELGFKEFEIIPLSWGPFTSAQTSTGLPGPFKLFRKRVALFLDLLYYKLSIKRRTSVEVQQTLERFSTGFLARAIK